MYCINCKKELRYDDIYCPKCGSKIDNNNITNNTTVTSSGNYSPIIGSGIGNEVKIDNYNVGKIDDKKVATYSLEKNGLKVKESTVKNIKVISLIIGFVSFVASIITIIESNSIKNPLVFPLLISCIILFVIFLFFHYLIKTMSEKEFIWIQFFWWTPSIQFILSKDKIYNRVIINGKCPKCNGNLKLFKNEETLEIIGVCKKNNRHRYDFDYTNLEGQEV